jgi:hypothetical protein
MNNLQAILDLHNIRHKDLAYITGCTTRSVYNWVQGIRPLPRSVYLLLVALDDGRIDEKWLAQTLSELSH